MDSPSIPRIPTKSLMSLTPPNINSSSSTNPDLSLSELSISELQPARRRTRPLVPPPARFSLFAPPPEPDEDDEDEDDGDEERDHTISAGNADADVTVLPARDDSHPAIEQGDVYYSSEEEEEEETGKAFVTPKAKPRVPSRKGKEKATPAPAPPPLTKEDQLRRTLFSMQKLNSSFNDYFVALQLVRDNELRLATKVDQTKQLLDKYVAISGQTEHTARLILNPQWQGSDEDYEAGAEAIRRQQEERLRLIREEELKREAEAQAAQEKEERLMRERESKSKKDAQAKPAGRGRGIRGVGTTLTRGVPSARGSRIPAPGTRPPSAAGSSSILARGRGRGRGTGA